MVFRKKLDIVRQTEAAECGLACLVMAGNYHGHTFDLQSMRRSYPISSRGMTLSKILEIANHLDLQPRAVRIELEDLRRLRTPSILHWDLDHFVVLKEAGRKWVKIYDPARGVRKLSFEHASQSFTGIAIELERKLEFKKVKSARHLRLLDLFKNTTGLASTAFNVLILAAVLEVITLSIPFYFQWIIDNAIAASQAALISVIGLGFLGIAVMQALFACVRGWLLTDIGSQINTRWSNSVYHHMLGLPLDWFERRYKADILSKFDSIRIIQAAVTTQSISTFIDGLASIAILAILLLYDRQLLLVLIGGMLLYVAFKATLIAPLKYANHELIINRTRQQQELVETLAGILPIKLNGKRDIREIRYRNLSKRTSDSDVVNQRLVLYSNVTNQLFLTCVRITLIWIGALSIVENSITLGMLIGFLTYAELFFVRVTALFDKLIEFRLLHNHLERLSDIVTSPSTHSSVVVHGRKFDNYDIEVRNLSFRYSNDDPWIISKLDFRVSAGESVAIVGASGTGKTTLAKLILGLFTPTEGQILLGGVSVHSVAASSFRDVVAAVMQEDKLFNGSIFDNICFWDTEGSYEKVKIAADLAMISIDIERFPMGFDTLVGDMGSSLSGGQVQRIILARALYREPKILLLDEATSHLDVELEHAVNLAVKKLRITKIIIAHRTETIKSADRIITLKKY